MSSRKNSWQGGLTKLQRCCILGGSLVKEEGFQVVATRVHPVPFYSPPPVGGINNRGERHILDRIEDYYATCPRCKAQQTLQFIEGKLIPTRKFYSRNSQVYHDCGSTEPCRILAP